MVLYSAELRPSMMYVASVQGLPTKPSTAACMRTRSAVKAHASQEHACPVHEGLLAVEPTAVHTCPCTSSRRILSESPTNCSWLRSSSCRCLHGTARIIKLRSCWHGVSGPASMERELTCSMLLMGCSMMGPL